jgi:hypothetical protein
MDLEHAVADDQGRRVMRVTDDMTTRSRAARLTYIDEINDYRAAAATARESAGAIAPLRRLAAPIVFEPDLAARIARDLVSDAKLANEGVTLRLSPSRLAFEAGDIVRLEGSAYRIERVEDGLWRELELRRCLSDTAPVVVGGAGGVASAPVAPPSRPLGVMLDIPLLSVEEERDGPLVAAAADPWPGRVTVFAGADAATLTERARATSPAAVGALLEDLSAGPAGRWDEGNEVQIYLVGAALASATELGVLNGANVLGVEGVDGEWEILRFRDAVLVAPDTYRISGLLRGLAGTEHAQGTPTLAGARVVSLTDALVMASVADHERGALLEWRFAPPGVASLSDPSVDALTTSYEASDLRPLSPVHLRARRSSTEVAFSWRRRTRIGGDDWAASEVPLGESEERYLFELFDGAEIVLSREVSAPGTSFTLAEEALLFADAPRDAFTIRVAQYSSAYGYGTPRQAVVSA